MGSESIGDDSGIADVKAYDGEGQEVLHTTEQGYLT